MLQFLSLTKWFFIQISVTHYNISLQKRYMQTITKFLSITDKYFIHLCHRRSYEIQHKKCIPTLEIKWGVLCGIIDSAMKILHIFKV